MGRPSGWASQVTGRPVMRSPGRPPAGRREHRQRFWAAIARGATSVDAAAEAGVSAIVGVRWFREGGGMPSLSLSLRCRGATCRSLSGRRSRSCAPVVAGAGDREPARSLAVDDLQGASAERREPRRPSRVSGVDCAVACGPTRPAAEAREAGHQSGAAALCAGPAIRCCAGA